MCFNSLPRFISIVLFVSILSLLYQIYDHIKKVEGLQNYEVDNLVASDFVNNIKSTAESNPMGNSLKDNVYNSVLFSQSDKEFYNDDEIINDIKFFNNTSHILTGYRRKNMIPEEI